MGSLNRTIRCSVSRMDSLPTAPSSLPFRLSGLPAWVRPNGRDVTEADAAFAAGIALKSLDDLVRWTPSGPAAGARVRRSNAPLPPSG
jgi:hypothetical protein